MTKSKIHLSVNDVDLSTVRTVLDKSKLDDNDALMDVTAIITVLLQIYKETEKQLAESKENKPKINIPMCTDLALNWLLNVFDRYGLFS